MRDGKVRLISSAPLRLQPEVLRQAQDMARSVGVSVSELIELLLAGVLEAEGGQVVLPPRPPQSPPRGVAAPFRGARVLVMDDFRRRGAADAGVPACPHIRVRASRVRQRAAQVRARSVRVCEAAERARETARMALEELNRAAGPAR